MPPASSSSLQPTHPHSLVQSLASSGSKIIAWLATQCHNISHATKWLAHMIAETAKTIARAPGLVIHRIEMISIAIAKFLLLVCGGLLAVSLIVSITIALYNSRTRIQSCGKSVLQRLRWPSKSAMDSHSHRSRNRLFDRVDLPPSYGTMDDHLTPGTTVRRLTVEESRGPGWHRKALRSFTRYADGRGEVAVAVLERSDVRCSEVE